MSPTQPLTRTYGVPPAKRQDLGLVALGLVATGPILIVLGFIADLALGYLYPLTFLLAAVVAVPLICGGLLLGLVAVVVHRGRWKGVAAMVASAEGVKRLETGRRQLVCMRASLLGWLIQAAAGSGGGVGGRRKRSGCAA